jgi:hypothetical protein
MDSAENPPKVMSEKQKNGLNSIHQVQRETVTGINYESHF